MCNEKWPLEEEVEKRIEKAEKRYKEVDRVVDTSNNAANDLTVLGRMKEEIEKAKENSEESIIEKGMDFKEARNIVIDKIVEESL